MTHDQTADLLKRAAVRLSQSYLAELENELDSRWDGEAEGADTIRDKAEEVRLLIVECHAAAAHIADDGGLLRSRIRRRGNSLPSTSHF